ncbi:MAG: OsmC family protein [Proteobacteria bacterium]|nr:OsmC family protein [Pseudomonadota bacterium]
MSDKAIIFEAEVEWTGEKAGRLKLEGRPDLQVAPPPQFEGPEGMNSPQEMFVASAAVCIMTTFLAMGNKVRAEWESFSCSGRGHLELVKGQGLIFTRIELFPKVTVRAEEQVPAVEKALELAKKYCLVTNSMKSEVVMHPQVSIA